METFYGATTTTFRRARLPPSALSRPHIPARARVRRKGERSNTTSSDTVERHRRETHSPKLCSTTFATWEMGGHCKVNLRPFVLAITIVFSGYLRPSERLILRLNSLSRTWAAPCIEISTPAAAESVYLAFRPACPQQNTSLHRGASKCRFSRDGTQLTTPRRSVTRRPNETLKFGSDQTTRTLERRLLNSSLHKGDTCPLTNRHTVCSTNTGSAPNVDFGRPHVKNVCEVSDNTARSLICLSPTAVEPGGDADERPPCTSSLRTSRSQLFGCSRVGWLP